VPATRFAWPRAPSRAAGRLGAILLAGILAACGGPTPTPRGQASPGPTGPGGPQASGDRFPLPSIQPTIPGLYTDSSVYAVGDEQVALLLFSLSCRSLADLIAAGEWHEVVRILGPANLGPNVTPPPSLPDTGWLVLERGAERLTVQLGGRSDCSAWAVRTAVVPVQLSGSFQASGQAILDQDGCRTSAGVATMRLSLAPQGSDVRVAVTLAVPLKLGEHVLDIETVELVVARAPLSQREIIAARQAALRAGERVDLEPPAGATVFAAPSPSAARVTITSTDPLVGELRLDGWLARDGGSASLTAGIACHLPGRELSRAVAAAGGTPGGSPGPTGGPGTPSRPPAGSGAGQLSVTFSGGADAGTKNASSADISCQYGQERPGAWSLGWGGVDERPGNVIGLIASAPITGRTGAANNPAMTIYVAGPDGAERQYGMGGDAGGTLAMQASPGSGVVTFDFDGRTSDGTRVTGRLVCPAA
jgi:hypothetical protein